MPRIRGIRFGVERETPPDVVTSDRNSRFSFFLEPQLGYISNFFSSGQKSGINFEPATPSGTVKIPVRMVHK